MKITKLAHACLLVEMPAPVDRTVLFDPGDMSVELVKAAKLQFLDDIVISHEHFDHCNVPLLQDLARQFPAVRILAPQPVVDQLSAVGIKADTRPADGLKIITAQHEPLEPLGQTPAAIGVHYLDMLTHPGDSHSITESRAILALPITAPWGSTTAAVQLATRLKPKYVIPIHDWMWKDDWRQTMYDGLASYFAVQGINFVKAVDGQPFVLDTPAWQEEV